MFPLLEGRAWTSVIQNSSVEEICLFLHSFIHPLPPSLIHSYQYGLLGPQSSLSGRGRKGFCCCLCMCKDQGRQMWTQDSHQPPESPESSLTHQSQGPQLNSLLWCKVLCVAENWAQSERWTASAEPTRLLTSVHIPAFVLNPFVKVTSKSQRGRINTRSPDPIGGWTTRTRHPPRQPLAQTCALGDTCNSGFFRLVSDFRINISAALDRECIWTGRGAYL